jgi:hypothetical protein
MPTQVHALGSEVDNWYFENFSRSIIHGKDYGARAERQRGDKREWWLAAMKSICAHLSNPSIYK